MGKMRRLTREYDLSLAVSGDTVTLTGSERNKRRLLSGLLYHESASAFTSTDSLQGSISQLLTFEKNTRGCHGCAERKPLLHQ